MLAVWFSWFSSSTTEVKFRPALLQKSIFIRGSRSPSNQEMLKEGDVDEARSDWTAFLTYFGCSELPSETILCVWPIAPVGFVSTAISLPARTELL